MKLDPVFHPDALQSRHRRLPRPTQPLHSCFFPVFTMKPFPSQITHFHDPIPPHVSQGCGFIPRDRSTAPPPNVSPARTAAPNATWSTSRCVRCILCCCCMLSSFSFPPSSLSIFLFTHHLNHPLALSCLHLFILLCLSLERVYCFVEYRYCTDCVQYVVQEYGPHTASEVVIRSILEIDSRLIIEAQGDCSK